MTSRSYSAPSVWASFSSGRWEKCSGTVQDIQASQLPRRKSDFFTRFFRIERHDSYKLDLHLLSRPNRSPESDLKCAYCAMPSSCDEAGENPVLLGQFNPLETSRRD